MEGLQRNILKSCLLAGLVLGAVGCKSTTQDQNNPLANVGQPPKTSSGFLGMGSSPKVPGPPPEQVVYKSSPKKGVKLETEIAWADTQVASATAEGRSAVERDQLLDDARQRYQKALHADPKNKAAMLGLAKLYEKSGDRARSEQMYQEAMKVDPKDHEIPYNMGKMLARNQDWAGACNACQMALKLDSENRTYHKTYGYCLARNNQWDAAFGSMMKIMPEADARCFLGRVLLDLDREPDAKQQFEMALQIDRGHIGALEMMAELQQGAQPGVAPQAVPPTVAEPNPVQRAAYMPAQQQWNAQPQR